MEKEIKDALVLLYANLSVATNENDEATLEVLNYLNRMVGNPTNQAQFPKLVQTLKTSKGGMTKMFLKITPILTKMEL